MRAFTLIESMMSLLIGLIALMGLAGYTLTANMAIQEDRDKMGVYGNLRMAHKEVQDFLQGVDRHFFDRYPVVLNRVAHATNQDADGIQISASCPDDEDSICLTVWDVEPGPDEPVIHRLENHAWPEKVSITPIDITYPSGPSEAIGAMSVLLFVSEDQMFCALVKRATAWQVYLADPADQPWEIPEELVGNFEVIHLGALTVTHLGVRPEEGFGKKLVYRPFFLDENGWRAGRSKSSYGHLLALKWVPKNDLHPHRLLMIGRSPKAKRLKTPIEIEGTSYNREVRHVAIEF